MSATASVSKAAKPAAPVVPRSVDRSVRVGLTNQDEEQLLKLDLSDLAVPNMNNLHVDGLKPSWFARLFRRN